MRTDISVLLLSSGPRGLPLAQDPEGDRGKWTRSLAPAVLSGHTAEQGRREAGGQEPRELRTLYECFDPNHVDSLTNQTKPNELKQTNRPCSVPASQWVLE